MTDSHFLLSRTAKVAERTIANYDKIGDIAESCKRLGMRVGLTMGTFDIYHEGHARYLAEGRSRCDVLIVGVDNDVKVKHRKGQRRPLVSETERMEILCHCRHVDIVFLKKLGDPKWQLIKTVRPDILIATQGTYDEVQLLALKEFCGEVVVLPPQSAASTTARIRRFLIETAEDIEAKVDATFADLKHFFEDLKGGH